MYDRFGFFSSFLFWLRFSGLNSWKRHLGVDFLTLW